MSYSEAKHDNIPYRKDSKGFGWYYPPCRICGNPVPSWNYISGTQYVCKDCRRELVILDHHTRSDNAADKKQKKLRIAIKRISAHTDIEKYKTAISWVEKNLHRSGWFQSTEEIMTALELIRCKVKAHHQVRVFDYFVDFVLPNYKVVLEIDGKIFHGKDRAEKQQMRDEVIMNKFGEGWEVIHIDAENINMNVTRLMPAIKSVLRHRRNKNKICTRLH